MATVVVVILESCRAQPVRLHRHSKASTADRDRDNSRRVSITNRPAALAPLKEATEASMAQSKAALIHNHRVPPPTELASISSENPLVVPNLIERQSVVTPAPKPNRLRFLSGA